MKYLSLISVLLLVAASHAQDDTPKIDENCDRIMNSMVDGCKTIRNSLISPASMEPKVVCCVNFRYNVCVQSVRGYATVARATRICPDQMYSNKIADLESNIAMSAVKTVCEKFETQTCFTDPLNNAWNSVKTNVQQTTNVDIDRLGEQIGKNWNQAMSSISNFAKGIQDSIAQQNIPGRLQEGATALQSSLAQGTKQLTDMVSGQGQNRYSMVGGDGLANRDDTLSLDSIVHSVLPEVEIVPKTDGDTKPADGTTNTGNNFNTNGKRFSLMDWIGSLTPSLGRGSNGGGPSPNDQTKQNEIVNRGNPYTVL